VESLTRILLHHSGRSYTHSLSTLFSFMSASTKSLHLLFGLPHGLFPGGIILIIFLPPYSSSLLIIRPCHLNRLRCTFGDASTTFTVTLMYLYLIWSSHIAPHNPLSIPISITSNLCSNLLIIGHVSTPSNSASLITIRYLTLPHSLPYHTSPPSWLSSLLYSKAVAHSLVTVFSAENFLHLFYPNPSWC